MSRSSCNWSLYSHYLPCTLILKLKVRHNVTFPINKCVNVHVTVILLHTGTSVSIVTSPSPALAPLTSVVIQPPSALLTPAVPQTPAVAQALAMSQTPAITQHRTQTPHVSSAPPCCHCGFCNE